MSLFNALGTTHLLVDVLGWFPTTSNPAATTRVDVGPGGIEADTSASTSTISSDGRYITYQSAATNLVAGDSNALTDVFLFDRVTATTTRVSVASDGTQSIGGQSSNPAISAMAATAPTNRAPPT